MRSELIIKTKSIGGTSDLTLLATLKPGLVPSLESMTYNTRVKRLLKALNMARTTSHEYSLLRPFSDAVERVGKIHSVRVAVLEPENKVLLSATFDGAWESYIRVLWQKVGALLDVIFCNTIDYVTAVDHSYEEWSVWARRVQIESNFFYSMPETTRDDARYARSEEAVQLSEVDCKRRDLLTTSQSIGSAESVAWRAITANPPKSIPETGKQGIQALAVLYRLTELFVPNTDDGKYLHRAVQSLLFEMVRMKTDETLAPALQRILAQAQSRYGKQIDWLFNNSVAPRPIPSLPSAMPTYDKDDVQGGIVETYNPLTHGCLVMMAIDNPKSAAAFLTNLIADVTSAKTQETDSSDNQVIRVNVAFTEEGLRAGLDESTLSLLPAEFREGMRARSSVLGDFRVNHPRRWHLPICNWPNNPPSDEEPKRIDLSAIHVVVQLRVNCLKAGESEDVTSTSHPLHAKVAELSQAQGVSVLSVQPLRRHVNAQGDTVEHFGFSDGSSQPSFAPTNFAKYPNQIQLGEILLGYNNEADFVAQGSDTVSRERISLLRNGTFLVIRKLSQDVPALYAAAAAAANNADAKTANLGATDILEKMMGRKQNGAPLFPVAGGDKNDFTYDSDPTGAVCPLQAHIRRVNPRNEKPTPEDLPGRRRPRIIRAGMSYGPRYNHNNPQDPDNSKDRGLVFMAYNASIGEQFEVLQRWISGANSTGVSSKQSDPFFGVADNGSQRHFRFHHNNVTLRVPLDGQAVPLSDSRPFAKLEWGMYLFVPSMTALKKIRDAMQAFDGKPKTIWSQQKGLEHIARLQTMERMTCTHAAIQAWKALLEDPVSRENFESAAVWDAIRNCYGGVLRTPYGVLIARRDRVMEAFSDRDRNYSVCGYRERMRHSIGEIYLGLDRDGSGEYEAQATKSNAAIKKISRKDAYVSASTYAKEAIDAIVSGTKAFAASSHEPRWDLTLDLVQVIDHVLTKLCSEWFDLPENAQMKAGSVRWDWKPGDAPTYPGHFIAPSRFMFQPHPGPKAEELGCEYGIALKNAFLQWVIEHRNSKTVPKGFLASDMFAAFNADDVGNKQLASVLVGTLVGLIPPVDGNLKLTLNEWLRDGTFWQLRAKRQALEPVDIKSPEDSPILKSLIQSMQLKPSPEVVWRTATRAHRVGDVDIQLGDRVVISIASATQECLLAGDTDVYAVFGGNRDGSAGAPTHACPAYEAAMGILLGVLSALVCSEHEMRASPVPLTLSLEGSSMSTHTFATTR